MEKLTEIVSLINQVPIHLGTLVAFAVIACIFFGFEWLEKRLLERRKRRGEKR